MRNIKLLAATLLVALGVIASPLVISSAHALDPGDAVQKGVNKAGGGSAPTLGTQITNIVNVLLFILGIIAVIVIIIGGIKYTVSGGDSGAITSAKNTILYAVIGLIVAMLAYVIVKFVVDSFA